MKSKDIKKLIFINPSPNMYKISRFAEYYGKETGFAFTDDFLDVQSDKLFYLTEKKYLKFDLTMLEQSYEDECIYYFKSGLFKKNNIKKNLRQLHEANPYFINANFNDLQLIKRQRLKESYYLERSNNFKNMNALENSLEDGSLYVAGWFPGSFKGKGVSEYCLSSYETDLDIENCFNKDFFILMYSGIRAEIFVVDKTFFVLSNYSGDIIEKLKSKINFLKKFNFTKKESKVINRNINPWLVKKSNNFAVINDYSFFTMSVKLPEDWYSYAGRYLCTEMQL